ncbi:hypothetical protein V5T82_00120 [Magnetovibrio sp. PR-2]|uniref:hypothetical protein n=1 Tax=Magnetovibrio sp. PR-2 TaxID=3120356 RepID=UPI002FCE52FE
MLGIVLLSVAFLITGAEMATRVTLAETPEGRKFLVSTWLVWQTVAPQSFAAIQDHAQITLIRTLTLLPGWILFGVPGLVLVALFRKTDPNSLSDEEFKEHEESLYLIDKLAAAAEKEDLSHMPDDLTFTDPDDVVPAEDHYAQNPVEDDLLPDRDYLLGPNQKP